MTSPNGQHMSHFLPLSPSLGCAQESGSAHQDCLWNEPLTSFLGVGIKIQAVKGALYELSLNSATQVLINGMCWALSCSILSVLLPPLFTLHPSWSLSVCLLPDFRTRNREPSLWCVSFTAWRCPLSIFYVACIFFILSKVNSMVPDLLDRFLFARLSEVRSVPRIFEHGKSVPSLKHSNEMNLVIHSIIVRELSYLYFFYTHGSQAGLIVRTFWMCAYVLSSPFLPLLYSLSYPETAERFL